MSVNLIFFISLAGAAALGFLLGFGKSLKITTKGIFGIIISITACVMLGGTVKSISAVTEFIKNVDAYFAGLWSFLGKLYLGTAVYYICFFIVTQVARVIIVKMICGVDSAGNKGVKIISKALGALYVSAFCFALCLLFFAVIKTFENTEFVVNLLAKIDNSVLMTLYMYNPIKL